jgi:hypothetical protein
MNTERNRPATMAAMLRAIVPLIRRGITEGSITAIECVADELESLAAVETTGATLGANDAQIAEAKAALVGEGPSVDDMLEWACENVCEFRKVRGKVRVIWIDASFETRSKYGDTWREAITKAMAEQAAVRT